jgi:hypothetical protein
MRPVEKDLPVNRLLEIEEPGGDSNEGEKQ